MSDELFMRLQRKMFNTVTRGVIKSVENSNGVQFFQSSLQAGEVKTGMANYAHVGFHSHPVTGADSINLAIDGNRSNMVCIATNDKRVPPPHSQEGWTTMYNSKTPFRYIQIQRDAIDYVSQKHSFTGYVDTFNDYRVDGVKVVGNQQPTIEPSSGSPADNTRAVNEVIAMLKLHGLIA